MKYTKKQSVYTGSHFRSLLEVCNTGVIVTDANGYIVEINDAACVLLRMKADDCLGNHFFQVFDFNLDQNRVVSLTDHVIKQPFLVKTKYDTKLRLLFSFQTIKNEESSDSDTLVTFYSAPETGTKELPLSNGFEAGYTFSSIVKASSSMGDVERISRIAAKTTSNVLICGESGTGKELIAQAIHNASSRAHGPFIALNCGAIPQGLIESELFGYEGGTFTGARATGQPGKFEMAAGGTIFLDEVGDMPMHLQVILLRVLQSREIIRLGGKSSKKIDVRVIAATNMDLEECISQKTFRSDLFYRLNVFNIQVPPLRDRTEDVEPLARHFISRCNERFGTQITGIDESVLKLLKTYHWPGNARELENTLEWASNMSKGAVITVDDLPRQLVRKCLGQLATTGRQKPIQEQDVLETTNGTEELNERELLVSVLEQCKGNLNLASAVCGVNRRTLYRKMEKFEIDPADYRK